MAKKRQHEELSSNVSRGFFAWMSRQLNQAFALALLFVVTTVLALVISIFRVFATVDDTELQLFHRYKIAQAAVELLKWDSLGVPVTFEGKRYKLTAGALYRDRVIAERVAPVGDEYKSAFLFWFVLSVFVYGSAVYIFSRKGRKLAEDNLLRGGQLVDAGELAKAVKKAGKASAVKVGAVPLPEGAEVQHMLVSGAPGAGKSVLISSILDEVANRGESAIIYDKTGDFVARFYDESRGDVILNPLDERCPYWNPWEEISHPADALRLARSLIPDATGEGAYFHSSAQSLLAAGLREMSRQGNADLCELLRLVITGSRDELATLVGHTSAAAALREGNEKALASILSTVGTYTEGLQWLPATNNGQAFSIRRFVESVDKIEGRRPWLFLTSREDFHETLRPLLACWVEAAAAAVLSLQAKLDRRVWVLLDELPTLGKLEAVQKLLAQGRKYGVAGVLGLQSQAQAREIFGRDGAEALSGLVSTRVAFRAPDADTAAWLSRELGERDVEELRESYRGDTGDPSTNNLASSRETRPVVMATEIQQLPNLAAYVRLPGDLPVARVSLQYKNRPQVAEHFVAADVARSVFAEMEQRAKQEAAKQAAAKQEAAMSAPMPEPPPYYDYEEAEQPLGVEEMLADLVEMQTGTRPETEAEEAEPIKPKKLPRDYKGGLF